MIVNRRDFEAAFDELADDRIDLVPEQDEITHHHGHVAHRLEGRPAAERKGWSDGDAVDRYLQVGTRKTVAMDISRNRSASARRGIDFLPIDALGVGRGGDRRRGANRKK
jgi:hypothetical protein